MKRNSPPAIRTGLALTLTAGVLALPALRFLNHEEPVDSEAVPALVVEYAQQAADLPVAHTETTVIKPGDMPAFLTDKPDTRTIAIDPVQRTAQIITRITAKGGRGEYEFFATEELDATGKPDPSRVTALSASARTSGSTDSFSALLYDSAVSPFGADPKVKLAPGQSWGMETHYNFQTLSFLPSANAEAKGARTLTAGRLAEVAQDISQALHSAAAGEPVKRYEEPDKIRG